MQDQRVGDEGGSYWIFFQGHGGTDCSGGNYEGWETGTVAVVVEEEEEEMKDRDDMTWYLKTSQLALALAIIRSKPPDKSSKEYAEHLAKIISRQDSKWKLRAEVLEAEVLHLRQQLLLSTFFPGLRGENRTPDAVGEALLPSNTEDYSGHFEDSGCDVSSDYIAGVPETVPTFNFRECGCSSSISDVSSSRLPLLTSSCVSKRDSVVSHMQFLQHFLELKKLSEAGGLRTDFKKLGNDCSTITDSFSQLLDGLVTSYSLSELPFSDVMHQAVCVITKLLSDADVSSQILGKCFKKLEDSMKRLVAVVLNSSNLNRVSKMAPTTLIFVTFQRSAEFTSMMIVRLHDVCLKVEV
ncbi:Meiosis-specific protein MEI4 [Varanus komodoensis]|nr:Meiosis-specific protein MEI4 [Varanus komodoensis]